LFRHLNNIIALDKKKQQQLFNKTFSEMCMANGLARLGYEQTIFQ